MAVLEHVKSNTLIQSVENLLRCIDQIGVWVLFAIETQPSAVGVGVGHASPLSVAGTGALKRAAPTASGAVEMKRQRALPVHPSGPLFQPGSISHKMLNSNPNCREGPQIRRAIRGMQVQCEVAHTSSPKEDANERSGAAPLLHSQGRPDTLLPSAIARS